MLTDLDPCPVIALNRAVAVGFAHGADAGLHELELVEPAGLPQRNLVFAARGELLNRLGHQAAFAEALTTVSSDTERRHRERRHRAVSDG